MAEQGGAAAGPQVQHDEFMEEDDLDGGSGDEGEGARARDPEPIMEELEVYKMIAVYSTAMEEWKAGAPDTAYAATARSPRRHACHAPQGRPGAAVVQLPRHPLPARLPDRRGVRDAAPGRRGGERGRNRGTNP